MRRTRLLATLLGGLLLGSLLSVPVRAQPFSAQIQRALAALGISGSGTLFPSGTTAAPSMAFSAQPGMGWYRRAANYTCLANDGYAPTPPFCVGGSVLMADTVYLGWANSHDAFGTTDTTIQRYGATALKFVEATGLVGFGLDFATSNIVKFRSPTGTDVATVDVSKYQVSGAAITSGTTLLSSGSGMAVANVGANSCGTSTATIAGNNNAAVVTVGTVAGTQCRIAFTFAATTEWDCAANDDTTTVAVRTTPVDTTHTDLLGAFTAGDKVSAICFAR